jgi:ribosomal protein L11 methylase PrmA
MLRTHIDGIPLDLASRLLPTRTYLSPGTLIHVHLHARAQSRFAGQDARQASAQRRMGANALDGLVDSLQGMVSKLTWRPEGTAWGDYYTFHNYSDAAMQAKRDVVRSMLEDSQPASVWDLGANIGEFSRIASDMDVPTRAFDIDPAAVERSYRQVIEDGETQLLPLVMDFTNPSPSLGWAHRERQSLAERGPADLLMALALVHHLAIGNNLPSERVAAYLQRLVRRLIIEFVPKSDSQVQRLLTSRDDIFDHYDGAGFEAAFDPNFRTLRKQALPESGRSLYLMQAHA